MILSQAVGENNCLDKSGGRKQLVRHFTNNKFYKCIGWILLEVTYGIKGNKILITTETSVSMKGQTQIHRDVCGRTDLLKVRCYL